MTNPGNLESGPTSQRDQPWPLGKYATTLKNETLEINIIGRKSLVVTLECKTVLQGAWALDMPYAWFDRNGGTLPILESQVWFLIPLRKGDVSRLVSVFHNGGSTCGSPFSFPLITLLLPSRISRSQLYFSFRHWTSISYNQSVNQSIILFLPIQNYELKSFHNTFTRPP